MEPHRNRRRPRQRQHQLTPPPHRGPRTRRGTHTYAAPRSPVSHQHNKPQHRTDPARRPCQAQRNANPIQRGALAKTGPAAEVPPPTSRTPSASGEPTKRDARSKAGATRRSTRRAQQGRAQRGPHDTADPRICPVGRRSNAGSPSRARRDRRRRRGLAAVEPQEPGRSSNPKQRETRAARQAQRDARGDAHATRRPRAPVWADRTAQGRAARPSTQLGFAAVEPHTPGDSGKPDATRRAPRGAQPGGLQRGGPVGATRGNADAPTSHAPTPAPGTRRAQRGGLSGAGTGVRGRRAG